MQAALCLIFAGSIAVAQWVVHDRTVNGSTRLAGAESLGLISIRPPEGWTVKKTEDPPYLEAVESADDDRPRVLVVTARRVPPDMTPEVNLRDMQLEFGQQSVPIYLGKTKGILVSRKSREDTEVLPAAGVMDDNLIAGCVTPEGIAIAIELKCPGEAPVEQPANVQLIRDVARRIQVQAGGAR